MYRTETKFFECPLTVIHFSRQHLGTVLSGLASQLRKYLAGAGSTAASAVMIKQMKMLQLATDSLLRAAT